MNKSSSATGDSDIHNLYQHSRFLRKIAWTIELIVVFIGLCISISLVTRGDNLISTFTLSAPFVMISLVELTKIPFVIGLWNARKSFLMYLVIIVFLSLITFETLLNGFERAFASINNQIHLNEIEISKLENQIENNQADILVALQDYQLQVDNISASKSQVSEQYQRQYSSAVKQNSRLSASLPEQQKALSTAKQQLIALKVEKSNLLKELSEKKEQRFKSSLERSQDAQNVVYKERNRLQTQLKTLSDEKQRAVDEASFLTASSVERKYDEKIRYVEEQLSRINDKTITGETEKTDLESVQFLDNYYTDLLSLKDDLIKQKVAEVKELTRRYTQAVNASNKSLAIKQANLRKEKQNAIDKLDNQLDDINHQFSDSKQTINKIKQQNNKLRYDIRVIETQTNTLALSNQIYRMASYVDNTTHYKEIKKETLTLVGLIWFGSLALIGSITGIALTLSGLHLHSLARKRSDNSLQNLIEAKG